MKVFRPVEHPAVAVAYRRGLERGEVGAATGFGHRDRGDELAGAEAGEPALLLLVGAQVAQVGRDDVAVDAETGRHRGGHPGHLLAEHCVEPVVACLGAAVGLGDLEAEEPLLAGLDPDVARDHPSLEELLHPRSHAAVEELARRGTERVVVGVVDTALHVSLRVGAVATGG